MRLLRGLVRRCVSKPASNDDFASATLPSEVGMATEPRSSTASLLRLKLGGMGSLCFLLFFISSGPASRGPVAVVPPPAWRGSGESL